MFAWFTHFFLPRHTNNQRAKLIHNQSILFAALLLLGTSWIFTSTRQHFPSVLGISADIPVQDLLLLTNSKRAEAGLQPLQLNTQLSQAAEGKARDMFSKQYWAHFAPDGTSPWDFIHGAGYSYVYAGENLARGFTTAQDTINAWMASPDHRANMLSAHYSDVGFAVERGPLPGDADTVLVVEMFGSQQVPSVTPKAPPVVALPETAATTQDNHPASQAGTIKKIQPPVLAVTKQNPIFDSAFLSKAISLSLLSIFLIVFALDIILTEQRNIVRVAGHSFDHLLFLLAILAIAISLGVGVIA